MKIVLIIFGAAVLLVGAWGGWQFVAQHDQERVKELQELPMTKVCVDPILSELKSIAFRRNAAAAGFVGACYMYGEGVPGNIQEAEKWLQQGANGGEYYSKKALEAIQDCRAAKESAERGDKSRLDDLARCYANGYGMVKDYAEARKWYLIAGDETKGKKFNGGRDLTPQEDAEAHNRAAAWKPK